MDGRRYDSMDGGGRATQDAVAENNAGAIVEGVGWGDLNISPPPNPLPGGGGNKMKTLSGRHYA
jgi:hypothetical protein